MSTPFVIWTMRRTGGTTLTDLLMSISEYPKIDHEPFNLDRTLGSVAKRWYDTRDVAQSRKDLTEALQARPLIKHCFEIHGPKFNRLLLETVQQMGYRHILLTREDEVSRILSLQLAEATGVWGKMGAEEGYAKFLADGAPELSFDIPASQEHLEHCFDSWGWLERELQSLDIKPFRLKFENLYSSITAGKQTLRHVFDYLDFDPETFAEHANQIENALRYKGQNSSKMLPFVTNANEARSTLQARLDTLRSTPAM